MYIPWRCADEDELGEQLGAAYGREDADHGGDGVADEGAARDAERVEDGEQVVDVGVERVVAPEVEVLRVDAAGADEVVEHDAVVAGEVGEHAAPRRLVRPEAVGQHHHAVAAADHPHVEDLQQLGAARGAAARRAAAPDHRGVGAGRRRRRAAAGGAGRVRGPKHETGMGGDWEAEAPPVFI
jgi:hypothetical protein